MALTRRSMLAGGAALLGAAVPFSKLFGRPNSGGTGRFGPLVRDPAGVFDLPAGFSYRVVQRSGAPTSDGFTVPGSFDGMGCFAGPDDTIVLMRNHECLWIPGTGPCRIGQPAPPEAFDAGAHGSVTRLVLKADTLEVVSTNLVLAGTVRNCAGGSSPWGWLSCEETTDAGHGYVFRCRTDANRVAQPEPIKGYGRYRHEAACIDPPTLTAYLTEDQDDGCVYRFVPRSLGTPFEGRLQALAVAGRRGLDTSRELLVGESVDVGWVDIDEPDPKKDTVRHQGRGRQARRGDLARGRRRLRLLDQRRSTLGGSDLPAIARTGAAPGPALPARAIDGHRRPEHAGQHRPRALGRPVPLRGQRHRTAAPARAGQRRPGLGLRA
jgi:hypothetical protein